MQDLATLAIIFKTSMFKLERILAPFSNNYFFFVFISTSQRVSFIEFLIFYRGFLKIYNIFCLNDLPKCFD